MSPDDSFRWGQPLWLWLLWASPLVIALAGWGMAARAARLRRFGYDAARSAVWLKTLWLRRWQKAFLLAIAMVFLTLSAAQPRANPQKTKFKATARDLAVVLDVSKSMLAEDIQPSRLERSKLELEDLCDAVKAKGSGDRLGLVAFAGNAVIKCPMTSNYSYFKRVLRTVDFRSAPQGGTRIGDGVRKALSELLGARVQVQEDANPRAGETVLADERKARAESFADILIITDGEDMDSFPLKAAQAASVADVGIYAVGIGSPEGSPIPIRNARGAIELLKARDGEVVRSKLDEKTLLDMVNAAPRGGYLPVGTSDFDLADFFAKTIAQEVGREIEDEEIAYTEIFQPFLLAGLAFYAAYLARSERPRRGQLERMEATT